MFAKIAVGIPLYPHNTLLDYKVPEELVEFVKVGSLVEVPFRSSKVPGIVFSLSSQANYDVKKIKSLSEVKIKEPVFDEAFLKLLLWMSEHYLYPLGEVAESAIPAGVREASIKVLEKTFLSLEKEKTSKAVPDKAPPLNPSQEAALYSLRSQNEGAHLLWGVTGSGKTEVYLNAIAEKIEAGEGAIVLVPEISLTPQLTDRFERRFPGLISVFHSDQKPTDTRKSWLRTFLGKSRIAIGPRSALFAPVQNLGIIIVDEEHDSSYKQEERLKYHARETALELCRIKKIPLVLGSATPSCESFSLSQKTGNTLSLMPERAHGEAVLPQIEIVDLKKNMPQENKNPSHVPLENSSQLEPSFRGDFFFTKELRQGLEETLSQKKQAILFLNRRGLGSQSFCPKCGDQPECPHCELKLTPHRKYLSCHYCGFQVPSPLPCQNCKQGDFSFVEVGLGTEAVEAGVLNFFPKARVLRLDRDTTSESGSLHKILEAFRNKEADILIGTQMVAKGHDFPDVTFVGVMLADLGWSIPDFRATEKSLQLLLQVSGRAGRSEHKGKVVIQSFQPDAPILEHIKRDQGIEGYKKFLESELIVRKELCYSPWGYNTLLRFEGVDRTQVEEAAYSVKAALSRIPKDKLSVLGPTPSPLSKIALKYRFQILVKSQEEKHIHKALSWIDQNWNTQGLEKKYKTRLVIDVDPVNML